MTDKSATPHAPRKTTFVSYATANRPFVKNLADTLIRFHLDVWYDEYEIKLGESIWGKINEGLAACDWGVVVLTHQFFNRSWTKKELAALATMLGEDGRMIPVFHKITPEEVGTYQPLLRDVKGLDSKGDVKHVAAALSARVLGIDDRDDEGRQVFRRRTVSISNLPLTADQAIADMRFKDCVIQGIATLAIIKDDVRFRDITFNHPFTMVPERLFTFMDRRPLVGVYGARNLIFDSCRFKDVGFIAPNNLYEYFRTQVPGVGREYEWPEHLR